MAPDDQELYRTELKRIQYAESIPQLLDYVESKVKAGDENCFLKFNLLTKLYMKQVLFMLSEVFV